MTTGCAACRTLVVPCGLGFVSPPAIGKLLLIWLWDLCNLISSCLPGVVLVLFYSGRHNRSGKKQFCFNLFPMTSQDIQRERGRSLCKVDQGGHEAKLAQHPGTKWPGAVSLTPPPSNWPFYCCIKWGLRLERTLCTLWYYAPLSIGLKNDWPLHNLCTPAVCYVRVK